MESWALALLLDGICSCEMLLSRKGSALAESHVRCRFRTWPCLTRTERVNEKPKPVSGFTSCLFPAYLVCKGSGAPLPGLNSVEIQSGICAALPAHGLPESAADPIPRHFAKIQERFHDCPFRQVRFAVPTPLWSRSVA